MTENNVNWVHDAEVRPLRKNVKINGDVITIYGIKYSGELFRHFGLNPSDERWFKIVENKDGILTIQHEPSWSST